MSADSSGKCNRDQLLGQFMSDNTHLSQGLKRAEELLGKTTKTLENHASASEVRFDELRLELETVRNILKSQSDRVTELMQVTSENTEWLLENGQLVEVVENHEDRITGLEHNRTFLKGVVWLAGIAFAFFTATPLLQKLINWLAEK